jgi:MFS family permease
VGQGCFLAAIIPIVNSLVSDTDRRHVFARRYQVLNATLAGGSLAAGGVISALSRDVIPHLFVVNALGYLPLALTLLLTRRFSSGPGNGSSAEETTGEAALPVRVLLKSAFAVSLFQLGVYLLGYTQFEATAPLVAATLMHINLGWIWSARWPSRRPAPATARTIRSPTNCAWTWTRFSAPPAPWRR